MSDTLIVAAVCANLVVSAAAYWQVRFALRRSEDRADRATAALLHVVGESKAAHTIVPAERPAAAPQDGRSRPVQIGLSPR